MLSLFVNVSYLSFYVLFYIVSIPRITQQFSSMTHLLFESSVGESCVSF